MPLCLRPYPTLGVWKTEESADQLLSLLEKKEEYLPFLEQCKSEGRKVERLAVRVLLKTLIGYEALVAYHPNGAPYIPGSSYNISISHTKGYVAVVLTDKKTPAGIDIEHHSERILKIRSRFLSEEENQINNNDEASRLLLYWCAKETAFKMLGQEGVDFRKHLHVTPFRYAQEGKIIVSETRTHSAASFSLEYRVTPEFALTFSPPLLL